MKKYLLGIDNGGSVIKAALFSADGQLIASSGRSVPIRTSSVGYVERDPAEIWKSNCIVIRETIEKSGIDPSAIFGIGVTGYGNGILLADDRGDPVGPAIVSTDSRAQSMVNELRKNGIEEQVFALNHQGLWSAQTSVLLSWLKHHSPELDRQARWFLGIKDYIRLRLTGEFTSEITEASSAGLMNLHTLAYDRELFRLLDIGDCFDMAPPCLSCTDACGTVTEAAALETGLKPGTPVTGSMFDVDAGLLASGILDGKTACMIAGTWSINEYLDTQLRYGYGESTNSVSCAFLPGHYLVEESTPTSASNLDWYLRELSKLDSSGKEVYSSCNRIVDSVSPDESDVVFVPYLFSSATHPDAKACFLNVSAYSTQQHMLRAVYEGVVFSSVFHVRRLMEGGNTFSKARLSGGLIRSEVWSQMMADAVGIPMEIPEGDELSALGAAMAAGVGCGLFSDYQAAVNAMTRIRRVYEPDPEAVPVYRRKFRLYEKALKALDVFHS